MIALPMRGLAAALLLCASCAAPAARPDPLAAGFARADAQRARQLAPDLYGRAERAHQDARAAAAAEPELRADLERKAELLLAAAIAEARRIELERAAAAAEARAVAATHARARLERERLALEQHVRREQSAGDERAHAARVLAGAAPAAATATATATAAAAAAAEHDARPHAEQVQIDAAFLVRRAQLLLAAALQLGLPEARARTTDAAIAAAQRALPGTALAAARAALRDAERALGEARAATDAAAASAQETDALIEMAAERGFAPEPTWAGVALGLAPLFAAGSAQLSAHGRAQLAQVAALAAAHPRGAIAIEYPAAAPGGAATDSAARLALARARRVEQQLKASEAGRRVQVAPAPSGAPAAEPPRLLFRAYGSGS